MPEEQDLRINLHEFLTTNAALPFTTERRNNGQSSIQTMTQVRGGVLEEECHVDEAKSANSVAVAAMRFLSPINQIAVMRIQSPRIST